MRDGILHNPRCSKSRETLKLLRDRGVDLPVIEYLQTPPTKAELAEICRLLGVKPLQLVRTKEALFAELGLEGQRLQRRAVAGGARRAPEAAGAADRDPQGPGGDRTTARAGTGAVRRTVMR